MVGVDAVRYNTEFDLGDKVQLSESGKKINAGSQIHGASIQSIIIDNNSVWYEVIHNTLHGGMHFKTLKAKSFMIEKVGVANE
jgi:hypothetical protein